MKTGTELREVLGEDSVSDDPAPGLKLADGSPSTAEVSDPLIREECVLSFLQGKWLFFFPFSFSKPWKGSLFPQVQSSSEVSWATHETILANQSPRQQLVTAQAL